MWIKTSLIALGLVGAMTAGTPAPTLAQVCTSGLAVLG